MFRHGSIALVLQILFACLAFECRMSTALADDKIELLIKSLVSTNAKPDIRSAGSLSLPDGFDRSVQKRIVENWDELLKVGEKGFPNLIAHYDDNEYSTSIASQISEYWHTWTVGQVCREILISQIEPYGHYTPGEGDPRSLPRRPSYCRKHLDTRDKATKWWQEHQKKSLREIQLEALDWIITEEKKQDIAKFSADIQELTKMRERLAESTEPLKTSGSGYSAIYRLGGREGSK